MHYAAVVGDRPDEVRFALALEHLHPDRALEPEDVARDSVALVTALDGHHDARFVLQMAARPNSRNPGAGALDVHLVVTVAGSEGAPPWPARVDELCDDLLDILEAPPVRWGFRTVDRDDTLGAVLTPLQPAYLAEVARREEPATPVKWAPLSGFSQAPAPRAFDRSLWSMWTLGPPASDLRRLATVLLAQEAPVCIRIVLHPTALASEEREALERLVMYHRGEVRDGSLLRASLTNLEDLLYLRPLFEMRCLVASPEPISRSLLSALGHAVSEPPRHGSGSQTPLQGGFAVIRGGPDVEVAVLRDAFEKMHLGEPTPSLAGADLQRLRRILGAWEAANVFRFPVTDDDFPGMEALTTPRLLPPLGSLPARGQRIGRLVAHGERPVLLDSRERFRHLYVSGQTGTGKSTLLLNLILQDIIAGAGVAVLDPHGDLIDDIVHRVPEERRDDVVLVDPADPVAVVGVNLLDAETPIEEEFIVSELAHMCYSLFDPRRTGIVGPRFETMLRQAALLLMANPDQPASFLDISTLFVDAAVRKHLVDAVEGNPILSEFWRGEMQMTRSNEWQEVVSWFRSKFEVFRTSKLVRNVVGQAESTISFSDILGERRILLVNLSKGMLGEYNSALVGHVVFTRLWSAVLQRASVGEDQRPDFFVYIDEFQNMTSDSLPDVLSEARKFRVGITLANQFFSQVPEQTRDAIMGNVANRVTFRLGPKDAALFAGWLGRNIHPDDLITLPNYVGIASLSEAGVPLNPLVLHTDPSPARADSARAAAVRDHSRRSWARPVELLDEEFFARWRHVPDSLSSRAGPAVESAHPTGSFLDHWLEQRRAAREVPVEIVAAPPPGSVNARDLLIDPRLRLSMGQAEVLADGGAQGSVLDGFDVATVGDVIERLEELGFEARVVGDSSDDAKA